MKIFTQECKCCVCGGPALAPAYDTSWYVSHIDPRVCAMYLEERRRKLEEREKVLLAKEGSSLNKGEG